MRTQIINSFNMLDGDIYFRIFFTALVCGIIGFEREYHGKAAGLRTHILIGVGACTVMLLGVIYAKMHPGIALDPFRIAAGVISGIGFLGAGTIMKDSLSAKGLADAANIWVTAIIGLLIGVGYYSVAIIISIIILINFIILRKFKQYLEQSGKKCKLLFTLKGDIPEKKELEKILRKYGFTTVKKSYEQKKGYTTISYIGKISRKYNIYEILDHINNTFNPNDIQISEL